MLLDGSRQRFLILAALLAACALAGGSYKPVLPALIVLRPLLVLGIGLMLGLRGERSWRGLEAPATLLAIFAATMAIQLVPLPAGWWAAMPGHARYAGIVALDPGASRPISLAPDLTVNSLLALLPAVAVLVAFAGMRDADRWNTAWIVLGVCVLNVAVGLFQAAGGEGLPTLSGFSDEGVVTGVFANRNHGAVLLAATLPLVGALLRARVAAPPTRWLVLCGAAVAILPLILLSGSRQGMALGVLALGVAAAILARGHGGAARGWLVVAVAGSAIVFVVAAVVLSGRALSVARLGELADPGNEARFSSLPVVIRMTRDFLPFGIGYGAFDPVFRGYEPDALLRPTYFNRAHDDLIETVMSGGLPALVPLIGFLFWLGKRALHVFRRDAPRDAAGLGRAALAITALPLLASLVDYPLRAPVMSAVFAVACCLLATLPHLPGSPRRPGRAAR